MKTIYELLDEVVVDEQEMQEIDHNTEVTELEKARVKSHLKQQIKHKKPWQPKAAIAAALLALLVGGTGYVGSQHPAYAAEIPIIGDIFRFFDNGRTGMYDLYQENANKINVTKEDSGIAITMKEAIFDGKTLAYTFEIHSEQDLGDNLAVGIGPPSLKIAGYRGGLSGSLAVQKIDEQTYIGTSRYTLDEQLEMVNCQVIIDDIRIAEPDQEQTIHGKWQFAFTLQAVESKQQVINQQLEQEGFNLTIDNLNVTPMSFIIEYNQQAPETLKDQWSSLYTELMVTDDLGNIYLGQDNGGSGSMVTGLMNYSMTFGKLDEKATQLIITPIIRKAMYGGGVMIDEQGRETIVEHGDNNEPLEVVFAPITITLDQIDK